MTAVRRFQDLRVRQSARQLTNLVYDLTESGTFSRDFGLKDQIRRASVSVMSNIAEGFDSRTEKLFADFLGRAKASAAEVQSQLFLARDRNYVDASQFRRAFDLTDKISRQIRRLTQH